MKNVFFILIFMLMCVMVNAQSWVIKDFPADELQNQPVQTVYLYTDVVFSFRFSNIDDKMYALLTTKSIFEYSMRRGTNGRNIFDGIVGLYDENNNLVEKLDICYEVNTTPNECYPNKYTSKGGNNYKKSKKIIEYIKSDKGYVRFIAPLYDNDNFELKVECLK